MPRKMAILIAVLAFVVCAAYFDIYDYLKFNAVLKKADSELVRLTELDKDVSLKREYLLKLEALLKPRIKLEEIENTVKQAGGSFKIEKDESYSLYGVWSSETTRAILEKILDSANINVTSVSLTNNLQIPVSISNMEQQPYIEVKMIFSGVMLNE
ncbi:hypothetical protein [Pseudothermotoga elfii]